MNYVDIIILVVVVFFAYLGYLRGFIRDLADLLALILATVLAAFTYTAVGSFVGNIVPLPQGFSGTVGFFTVWFAVLLLYYGLMTFFYDRIPEKFRDSKYNRWLGILPATIRILIFIWFSLSLLFLLPLTGSFQQKLDNAYASRLLAKNNTAVSDFVGKIFGPAIANTVDFLTVKPQSSEFVQLDFTSTNVWEDEAAEKEMFDLLNKERVANGLTALVFDEELSAVGAAHCRDMFARGYFSHNTPDGKTPFDRMNEADITYLIAGENLALAPNVTEAFNGLMSSPSHKANILLSDYGRVGIAVINDGVHGAMFAQEFTD